MPANETLGEITPIEWKAVLETARDFDLNQGGFWDGHSGAVNAWVGPDDHPRGWPADLEITCGALLYPRSYLASVWMEWPKEDLGWQERERRCPVLVDLYSYEVKDWRLANAHGAAERLALMRSERRGRVDGDLEWLQGKWTELLEAARQRVPKPLELRLGETDGKCFRCGSDLRLIVEVLSSPYDDGGVGDWRHWCPTCRMLTVPREQILEAPSVARAGAIGRVIGVGG